MGITYKRNVAEFHDVVGVEAAEDLLKWLCKHPKGKLEFANCNHLHAAQLQVLMAAQRSVVNWPRDESLKSWLTAALQTEMEQG